MKTCPKCKETKPFEMFARSRREKDNCQARCKACQKAYRQANKEKIAEYKKSYYEENKEKVAERHKAYYEENKEKLAEYYKAYQQANKEKIADYDKAYRQANKEKVAEWNKTYRQANKEKAAEQRKAYRQANKEKVAEWYSRRRARKRNAIPKFLRNCDVEKKRLRDIYKLRDVLSVATGVEYHVDHMWPLSDGGPHWSGNLQIITAQENLSKNCKVCKVTKKNIRDSLKLARKDYEHSSDGHRDGRTGSDKDMGDLHEGHQDRGD